jgi:hypothetical protein
MTNIAGAVFNVAQVARLGQAALLRHGVDALPTRDQGRTSSAQLDQVVATDLN